VIAGVRLRPYALPLVRPWVAASAVVTMRRGILVGVEAADGGIGWGDCAPLPSSGDAGHRRVFAALQAAAAGLPGRAVAADPAGVATPEARWAVETALLDLRARRRGLPLARLLNGKAATEVAVNAALGPLDAGCAGRARRMLDRGFDLGKIKVGLAPVDDELRALRLLNTRLGGAMRLRLDANRSWNEADARRFLAGLSDLPVDGVEEPLAAPSLNALARLQDRVSFAVAIDESLAELGGEAAVASGAVRRLVVKPARLGGIGRSLDLAATAVAAEVELVVTSVVDSAIGVVAAAHLAAALPFAAAHGLATSAWLAEDVCPPPALARGRLRLPEGAGLGLAPLE
jgi:o-succinylbenzoate synthase